MQNPNFANGFRDFRTVCPLADRPGRGDIPHRVSTTFRNLIAFFS